MVEKPLYGRSASGLVPLGFACTVPGCSWLTFAKLLEVVTAAANVAEREGCDARKLVLKRHVPSPCLGAWIDVCVRGEGERSGVDANASGIVDTARETFDAGWNGALPPT